MTSLPCLPCPPAAAGVMGLATARTLQSLGYQVSGWSRTQPTEQQQAERAGITTFVGQQQLQAFVSQQDVLVCLLPLTAETTGAGPMEYRGWECVARSPLLPLWPVLFGTAAYRMLVRFLSAGSQRACRVLILHCALGTTSDVQCNWVPMRLWVTVQCI